MAGLTLPQNDLWVNLSPYERERMVPDKLVLTELGEDMLKEDYALKRLAASLSYPEQEPGKSYWNAIAGRDAIHRVRENNFNKVWIVPGKAAVYEKNNCALVTEASLEVLTQEDYLAVRQAGTPASQISNLKLDSSIQSFKTHILPLIENEVNNGGHFTRLRQIYHSLILAVWFKQKFKKSFYESYINHLSPPGSNLSDKNAGEKIFSFM